MSIFGDIGSVFQGTYDHLIGDGDGNGDMPDTSNQTKLLTIAAYAAGGFFLYRFVLTWYLL